MTTPPSKFLSTRPEMMEIPSAIEKYHFALVIIHEGKAHLVDLYADQITRSKHSAESVINNVVEIMDLLKKDEE